MKTWERWTFGVLTTVVGLTGCAYFWMEHLIEAADPFAVVNHPWQGAMLSLHVLASPPLILIFGIILNSHIMKKLRAPNMPNRRTGLLSLGTFGGMVGSGYLLQVVAHERWLEVLVAIHVATGVVFLAAYAAHLVISVRLARHRAWSPAREVV